MCDLLETFFLKTNPYTIQSWRSLAGTLSATQWDSQCFTYVLCSLLMFFIFSLICSALPARSRCFLLVDLCMLIELCIEFIQVLLQRNNQNVSSQGTATDLVVQIVLIAESQRLDH